MRAVFGVELLAVGELHDQALEPLVIERLAGLVEHANAPDHFFQALELVVEHTERSRRALLSAAHKVAFEEQLLCALGVGGAGPRQAGNGQREHREQADSHVDSPFIDGRWAAILLIVPPVE